MPAIAATWLPLRSGSVRPEAREGPTGTRFRTIQVWPKDLACALRQAEGRLPGGPSSAGARPMSDMTRREFAALVGGLGLLFAVKVRRARAQQAAMPVIGFLDLRSPHVLSDQLRAFRQGLKDTGYIEGENVAVEYRWGEGHFDRLPMLAAELVHRRVAVIATSGGPAVALAAKAATATIPIVFIVGEDPVGLGLVASLGRPGGNLTGVNFLVGELTAKRLGLLHERVPVAAPIA